MEGSLAIPRALRAPVLAVAFAATTLCAACDASGPPPPYEHFRSRPDLRPPPVRILMQAHGAASGYVFIAPKKNVAQAGPLILDNHGQVVWFQPLDTRGVTDFRVQRYRGRPVLTWWRGRPIHGNGDGNYAIVDSSYRPVARVQPGNGLVGDIHEFLITRRNTALMTIFHRVRVAGRPVFEGALQEVDIATGRVLLEWHSIAQVGLDESYAKRPRRSSVPYDYFHINSIDVDSDGNLLVSARNTHAVYKLSRRTGRILWRLGGRRSDFRVEPGARFAWQHDARWLPDATISLFDNEAAPKVRRQSRLIVLRLEPKRRRAVLVRSLVHRPPLVSVDQGNAQLLSDGHFLVGWGHQPYVTEYDRRGRVVLDLRVGRGADSYRAYRFPWVGRPLDRPAVTVDGTRAYVSWNGATEISKWQLLAGATADRLRAVRIVRKTGFETTLVVPADARYVAVQALDRRGRRLETSLVRPRD